MKECEREQLILDLAELKGAINIMMLGLDELKEADAVACMAVLKYRLEQIINRVADIPPEQF